MFLGTFFAQLTYKAGRPGLMEVSDKAPTDFIGARMVLVSFKHMGICTV